MGHQRSLDGIRAIAVVAVLLFHAEFGWIPGGFLGVDVFFVVSGFLITSLMVEEWGRGGVSTSSSSGCGGPAACCPRWD